MPSFQKTKPSDKVPHKVYQVSYKAEFIDNQVRLEMEEKWLEALSKGRQLHTDLCEAILNNTKLLGEIKGFDLIVYDGPITLCAPLVGELLDIPRVEILIAAPNFPFGINHMIPMPVSYVPQAMLGFTDKMTFLERVINLLAYLSTQALLGPVVWSPMNALKVKYNIKPERSFQETVGDAEMVIIAADFALEYPQPLLPGMSFILNGVFLTFLSCGFWII